MKEKLIIITGASDGIGAVAANELHKRGARVVVIGRSPEKTKLVAGAIGATYYIADFAKLSDVRDLAARLTQDFSKIDVLINNAGGIFGNRELTEDRHELTFQVNYLAPYLLTNLLMPILINSRASVINTSSVANVRYGNIDIDDLDLEHGYSANRAYGNSKLENILFTQELHRRFYDKGLSSVAVHPGIIASNFGRETTSVFRFIYGSPIAKLLLESPEKGAEPLIWLATAKPGVDWQSGKYYAKHRVGKINSQATDPSLAPALWKMSEVFTRQK